MLAAVLHGAHDLRVEERSPQAPGAGEVLVRVACGGICGSDLSYFHKGGVGDFTLREPLTLGHEVAGEVLAVVPHPERPVPPGLAAGTRVAINPSRGCLACGFCRTGRGHLCRSMRFLGSAALSPHVQGAFSETVVLRADQCVPIPAGMPFNVAACAEPLAVALHAIRRAGTLLGRHVLVAGSGPIGLLCLAAARHAGAASVTVTDLCDPPLAVAARMGAASCLNVGDEPAALTARATSLAGFDVALEATGAASCVSTLPGLVRPGGRIVQIGMLPKGDVALPVNLLMSREIDLVGSFRFHDEFEIAVGALAGGAIDVAPILSASFPLAEAGRAFALAADRARGAIKVQLEFA